MDEGCEGVVRMGGVLLPADGVKTAAYDLCVANSYSCGNGCLKKSIAVRYPGIVVEISA